MALEPVSPPTSTSTSGGSSGSVQAMVNAAVATAMATTFAGTTYVIQGTSAWPSSGARPISGTAVTYIWVGPATLAYPTGFLDGTDIRIKY
jgi:hypothetical protein